MFFSKMFLYPVKLRFGTSQKTSAELWTARFDIWH